MKKIQNMNTSLLIYKQDRINQGDLKALAENIKTYGLQHPLLITQKNGGYDIIDGRRRLEACKIAGFKDVPCIVLTKDEANGDLSLILNTHRLNLGPVELYKMAARYVKDELKGDPLALPPEKIRAVAAKLNLDIHATCRILNIGRMDKKVQDLIVAGQLPMRLALLSINIKDQKPLTAFCVMCMKERPTSSEAVEWLAYRGDDRTPFRSLDDADFDTEKCEGCKYIGRRELSLFEELQKDFDEDENCCWNIECYQRKTKEAWDKELGIAIANLGLSGITKASGSFKIHDAVEYANVVPADPKKCKSCKQVKLASSGDIQPMCPKTCANIKQTKRSTRAAAKPTKRDPAKFTKEDKIQVLNERFAVAARKAMMEHFIIGTKEKIPNREIIDYSFRKKPTSYKRILFFIGFDKSENPFIPIRIWPSNFVDRRFNDKEEKDHAKIINTQDFKGLAQLNMEIAADHLASFDRARITPRRIDVAIQILYGEANWCKTHYDDIFAKLSKRSKQFFADIKPWKPTWAKATKKRKRK